MANPGPEGWGKLASAELSIAVNEAIVDLLGPEGMLHPPGYPMACTSESIIKRRRAGSCGRGPTPSRAARPEIMCNILGERVLGLPGDVASTRTSPGARSPLTTPRSAATGDTPAAGAGRGVRSRRGRRRAVPGAARGGHVCVLVNVADAGTAWRWSTLVRRPSPPRAAGSPPPSGAGTPRRRDPRGACRPRAVLASAVPGVPLNVDAENGYGHEPRDVAVGHPLRGRGAAGGASRTGRATLTGASTTGTRRRPHRGAVEACERAGPPLRHHGRTEVVLRPRRRL